MAAAMKTSEDAAAELLKAYVEVDTRHKSVANLKSPVLVPDLPLPEHVKIQRFLLINLCSVSQNPSSIHPGFRILGAFETNEDLLDHAQQFYANSDCALHQAYLGHTTIICRSLEDQKSAEYVTTRRDEIVRWHLQKDAEELEEFKKQIEEKRPGKINRSIPAMKAEARKKVRKATTRVQAYKQSVAQKLQSGAGKRVKPVPRDAELRSQNVAVIDVFDDPDPATWKGKKVPEPLVTIWGVFPDDAEAEKFMEYWSTATEMKTRHMYIVPCYEFIYPDTKDLFDMKEKSRNTEENKIIQRRKQEKSDIQNYTTSMGLKLPEQNGDFDFSRMSASDKVTDDKGNAMKILKNEIPTASEKRQFPAVGPTQDDPDLANPVPVGSASAGNPLRLPPAATATSAQKPLPGNPRS